MNVFILFAHPEPQQSFNRALLDASVAALEQQGHRVQVSDLYAMNFNPVASAADFSNRRFADRLYYDREQKHALTQGGLAADIQAEIEKILWCDIFIVQFPLYWFSMPAIMKGWFDRVFVNSLIYGAGKRFESGGLAGKKAMVCLTTGAYAPMFQADGLLGNIEVTLWPLHGGIFMYTGMQVLPPFIAWAPAYQQASCDSYVAAYCERMHQLATTPTLPFIRMADFDENFTVREGVVLDSVAHRNGS